MIANLRLAIRLAALVIALIGALCIHGLWRAFRLPSPWPRLFLGSVAWIVGARVRVIGRPLKRDVVFLANHLSWIDILALGGASGTAFIAKAEIEVMLRLPELIGEAVAGTRGPYCSAAHRSAAGDRNPD